MVVRVTVDPSSLNHVPSKLCAAGVVACAGAAPGSADALAETRPTADRQHTDATTTTLRTDVMTSLSVAELLRKRFVTGEPRPSPFVRVAVPVRHSPLISLPPHQIPQFDDVPPGERGDSGVGMQIGAEVPNEPKTPVQ